MNRRQFLRGAGVSLAIPLLPSLLPRRAWAQAEAADPPKRLLAIYLPNNETPDFPSGDGAGGIQLAGSYYAPLMGFEDRMTVIRGVVDGSGHSLGHPSVLSGGAHSVHDKYDAKFESLDQLVKRRESEATGAPVLSLHAYMGSAEDTSSPTATISATEALNTVPGVAEPIQIFQQIIGSYDATGSSAPPALDPQLVMRGNLLDAVLEDYKSMSAKLAPADRRLLDAHLTMIAQQQQQAQALLAGSAPVTVSCEPPATPVGPHSYDWGGLPPGLFNKTQWHLDPTLMDAKSEAFLGLIASSLVCGAAGSATFMFGPSAMTVLPENLQSAVNASSWPTNHEVAHDTTISAEARALHFEIRKWQLERVRYVLELLDVTDAEGRNVLDTTLVAIVSELGLPPGENAHSRSDVAMVLVGGGHGEYLSTGHFFDFGGAYRYGDLLLTLAHAMGYEDLTSYGRAEPIEGWSGPEENFGYGTELITALKG